jgi:protein-L-isoaspartate(D-aspartate) O-methyltransferase
MMIRTRIIRPVFHAVRRALYAALGGLAVWGGAAVVCQAQQGRQVFTDARNHLVDEEIVPNGIRNARVIAAIRNTPRHEFIPLAQRKYAYLDMALPIGQSQTISPPFIVAYMTEQIDPQPTDKVLEIGTGSGYQAAVLSPLVHEVYSIEIVPALGQRAAKTLKQLGVYGNVFTKIGDGYQGWPEHAPFDKIIVTCSPEQVPAPLVQQLKEGGRMIVPMGERYQQVLYLLKKVQGKLVTEALRPTLFVPMTGEAEAKRQILPDPTKPEIRNGSFEETSGDPPKPSSWHYQQQLELIRGAADAPSGKNYVTFHNAEPGRGSQALQGFAVDGRKVKQLEVSVMVRGKEIRPLPQTSQFPQVRIAFYDENRAPLGDGLAGQFHGTFTWEQQTGRINVPLRAREAILQIGLLGGTGELSMDAIQVRAVTGKR